MFYFHSLDGSTVGTRKRLCAVLTVFDDWYSVPFVKNSQNSQKTVKTAKMAIGVPIVTCLHRVSRIHKAAQTPLYLAKPPSHVPGQWPQPVACGQG